MDAWEITILILLGFILQLVLVLLAVTAFNCGREMANGRGRGEK